MSELQAATTLEREDHRLVSFMDALHAEEYFGTEDGRRDFLQNLSFEEFEGWITRVNGICLEKSLDKRGLDGKGYIEAKSEQLDYTEVKYMPPRQEERRGLLSDVFTAAKQLEPRQAATLLGLAINAIHPFGDGNGRTGRFVYTILAHGYDGSAADKQLFNDVLANETGRELINFEDNKADLPEMFSSAAARKIAATHDYKDQKFFTVHSGTAYENPDNAAPETLKANPELSDASRVLLHTILGEEHFRNPAVLQFCFEKFDDVDKHIKVFGTGDAMRRTLFMKDLIGRFTDQDVRRLDEIQADLKTEYIGALVDLFTNPQSQQFAQRVVETYRPDFVEPTQAQ